MPPPRSLYPYSCRGFICKSCASKVLCPRQPWAWRTITTSTGESKGGKRPKSNPTSASRPNIKFFIRKPDGTQEETSDPTAPTAEDLIDNDILNAKIAELEKELGDFKADKNFNSTVSSPEHEDTYGDGGLVDDRGDEREVARQLSEMTNEQREDLLAGMRAMADRFSEIEKPLIQHPIYNFDMKLNELPGDQASRLRKFSRLLKETALGNEFTSAQKKELWKRYSLNRTLLRNMSVQAPEDMWTFLWTVFAKTAISNPERLGRLKILAEEMEHAGITLEDTQMLVYLEACYLNTQKKNALDRWRSLTGSLGRNGSAVFKQFWELGTKMLAMDGHPQEALDAAVILFRGAPDANPRIITPIIASWTTSNDSKKMQKAWALYQRLRTALSSDIEMKDFDAITTIFLGADQPGLALGVFRDMMTMGDHDSKHEDPSIPVLEDVFEKFNLEVTSKEMENIDWSNLEALALLPNKQRNRFFFGSWIKKLLGEKDVTAALQVLRLMRQYRIRPYAIQLNGVVGALLRSNTAKGQAMGEQIGWEMIKARVEFLIAQEQIPDLQSPARPIFSAGKDDFLRAAGDLGYTPPATSETLAVLIESYRRRGLHPYIEDLRALFNSLRLRPSTYILNQFLLSYHKARDPKSAMEILHEFVDVHHVKPDLDTLKWLWEHMRQRRLIKGALPSQASARKLFAFTFKNLPPSITAYEGKTLVAEIYDLVIMCFGLVDDQLGTAIAIQAFQERLGIYPGKDTQRNVVSHLAATSKHIQRKSAAGLLFSRPPRRRTMVIESVLHKVKRQRAEELKERGIDPALMDETTKGEENIFLLTELLKSLYISKTTGLAEFQDEIKAEKGRVAKRSVAEQQRLIEKRNIRDAAKTMGVPAIRPWRS